ncbi:MAG: iron-sulfur cluster assembly scaffold protein [Anaerolineae bacterium]|nr:iron-sulfur cluster assembly scaffold protein [Anaerolineae bacterium]
MEVLYCEHILDHYRYPRNEGVLEDADISHQRDNPLCGDMIRLDIRLKDGVVEEARFSGRGCVLSIAAASMLTEEIVGRSVAELEAYQDEDIFRLLGITLGPVRARCALLPLQVLKEGLSQLAR